jgi:Domain of unknown function (DUF4399)/Family of unknown function (DUF6130)
MNGRTLHWLALGLTVAAAAACGGSEPEPAATSTSAPPAVTAAKPAASSSPRVFFVEPADGATVKSPVKLRFGIENYELAAVPQGDITAARPQMGHHHVGVDTECLPPGTVIPKANPWVHHGGAQTEMDMQLTPGKHRLTLQLGDDTHTTIAGLCSSITVNVVE